MYLKVKAERSQEEMELMAQRKEVNTKVQQLPWNPKLNKVAPVFLSFHILISLKLILFSRNYLKCSFPKYYCLGFKAVSKGATINTRIYDKAICNKMAPTASHEEGLLHIPYAQVRR